MSSFDGKQEFDLNGIFISELKSEILNTMKEKMLLMRKIIFFQKTFNFFFLILKN